MIEENYYHKCLLLLVNDINNDNRPKCQYKHLLKKLIKKLRSLSMLSNSDINKALEIYNVEKNPKEFAKLFINYGK